MILPNDFKAEYTAIEKEIQSAVADFFAKGWYVLGEEVSSFEREFAQYIGQDYCVGVANGLEALFLALKSL
ncbi:MAG: DegT/DnrJ/EryC1/StrS family aminotransferase, partial [Bacteroidota bacterium]